MTIKHLYPTQRPSLDLNFARTKRLDPRVTFTRGSTATYVGNDGLIKTAVDNEPRFDHDPVTGESLGLLVEESRTNYQPTDVPTSVNGSILSTTEPAPDGSNTAVLLNLNIGPGEAVQWTSSAKAATGSLISGEFFTVSYWLKGTDGDSWTLSPKRSIGALWSATETHTISSNWARYTQTFQIPIAGTTDIIVRILNNTSANNLYIWGIQVERGAFPTSYIPTSGSTVTRAADVASITGSNFSSWYNQDEGTIFAEAKMSFALSQSGKLPDVYASGSFPNRLWALYFNNGINQLTIGADAHSRNLETFTSFPQSFKVAQALSNTSLTYSASKDGGNVLTGSLSKAITNTSSISIGSNTVGAIKHISRLTYYPQRLPDATLQALTL